MENTPPQTKKRDLKPYLLGAVLSYVFCLVTGGRMFVAGADWDFGVAAVGALCFWPFLAFFYLAVQLLLKWVLRQTWEQGLRHAWLVLNVPALILILLAGIAARMEPGTAFRHFLANPIPRSVEIKQFARWQGIGEPMSLRLVFEIQQNDLQSILRSGGYARTNDITEEERASFGWLPEPGGAGTELQSNGPLLHYISTNDPSRNLYLRTNHAEAYFLYAKPYH